MVETLKCLESTLVDLVLIHSVTTEGRVRYLSIGLPIDNLHIEFLKLLTFLFLSLNILSISMYIVRYKK